MKDYTLETQALQFLKNQGLLASIQDGETLLFTWNRFAFPFIVKDGKPIQVSFSEIAKPDPNELTHHIMFAKKDDEDDKDDTKDDEDDKDDTNEEDSNGGWLSDVVDWIGDLASSGTIAGGGVEPMSPPPRLPDFPVSPPGPPLVPPVVPQPTIPSAEPGWGFRVKVTIFRW